jgi:nitrite reductase/ring-hydroxylating ferredoxin subunit
LTPVRRYLLGWSPVLEAAEFADGDGGVFRVRGVPIALYKRSGQYRAVGARCPHAGSLLSEFATDEGTALCPSHGWEFRLTDGGCTTHAAHRVPVYPARELDGVVWVRVKSFWAWIADFACGAHRRAYLDMAERLR